MKELKFERFVTDQGSLEATSNEREILKLLEQGTLTVDGLLPWGSNYTFLGHVADGDRQVRVVYKPVRGERPLWDFPHGTLAQREVAAYVVCHGLGWDFVPPTALRDGPHGPGSVQMFMDVDQDAHFFTFREDLRYRSSLQALSLFDVIVNNADRKGGHCLRAGEGWICAIDHGVCFNAQPKLRTVIWDYAGQKIPASHLAALCRLQNELASNFGAITQALIALLTREEVGAVRTRLATLIEEEHFPEPPENRRPFPWPLV